MISVEFPTHGFLFGTRDGCWDTAKQTEIFVEYTTRELGFRCTSQQYRHIAKAIDRQFIRGTSSNGDEEDGDEDVAEEDAVHDLMAGHSIHIGTMKYGLNSALLKGLSAQATSLFRGVSDGWQFWLKLESRRRILMATVDAIGNTETVEERCQSVLERLYGIGATFRSLQQRDAVYAIVNGVSPLIAVLPTGGGKTLLIMLPALLDQGKSTIVVVPLVALAKDLLKRCKEAQIDGTQWTTSTQRRSTVIIVTSNMSITAEFRKFASALHLAGHLARLVYDEIHSVITEASYRDEMLHLKDLQLPVQVIGLTATLPLHKESQVNDTLILPDCIYIRAPTNRINIVYSVSQTRVGTTEEQLIIPCVTTCMNELLPGDKILLYGRYVSVCQSLASKLDAKVYHSKDTDKDKYLRDWEDGTSQVLVATGALGAGVDVKDVRLVIHAGEPWGITEFEQESGRAGRDGRDCECVIVMTPANYARLQRTDPNTLTEEQAVMRQFIITEDCRLKVTSKYFDGVERSCAELNCLRCDNCQSSYLQTEQGRSKRAATEHEQEERLKKVKYGQRVEAQTQSIRTEGSRRAYLTSTLIRLQDMCSVCWLLRGEGEAHHQFEGCSVLPEMLGQSYGAFRVGITFQADTCCFTCGRPGDMCGAYSNEKECKTKDVVTPLVLAGFLSKLEVVRETVGFSHRDIYAFVRWMGRRGRVLDCRCSHGFMVFEALIRNNKKD